jgi:hypothetical protein
MKKTALSLLFLLSPLTALAASHTFTCADGITAVGGVVCTGTDTFDSFASGNGYIGDKGTNYFPLTSGGTYYLTVTYSGTGRVTFGNEGNISTPSNEVLPITGSLLEQSFTAATGIDTITFYVYGGTGVGGNAANNFDGSLSTICLDDDGVSCTPPPPNANPWVILPSIATLVASSSEASNPIFAGLISPALFGLGILLGALLVAWLIARTKRAVRKVTRT